MNGLLTRKQVAERLKVSISTIRKYVRNGELKGVQVSTRGDRRFSEEEVASFIKRNTDK
jgi:excisionase family DNA binding protein